MHLLLRDLPCGMSTSIHDKLTVDLNLRYQKAVKHKETDLMTEKPVGSNNGMTQIRATMQAPQQHCWVGSSGDYMLHVRPELQRLHSSFVAPIAGQNHRVLLSHLFLTSCSILHTPSSPPATCFKSCAGQDHDSESFLCAISAFLATCLLESSSCFHHTHMIKYANPQSSQIAKVWRADFIFLLRVLMAVARNLSGIARNARGGEFKHSGEVWSREIDG